jgi:acetyl/propionyl-CoA carboxylase alpha subunit
MSPGTSLRKDSSADAATSRATGPDTGTGSTPERDPRLTFRRVLIANRGEIAVRIIRACRELGLETVAVYSDADAGAVHVRLADSSVRIGPPAPTESYLNIEAILGAAAATAADAVHPGYGFLSERATFARRVTGAGLAFVGPTAETIEALGDKLRARRLAREAGVPVVPGTLEPATIDRPDLLDALAQEAAAIGLPVVVKAAAGGGGRGMRRVARIEDLPVALVDASREAAAAFGDGRVYLEREVLPARHIEVQLLADATGRVVALGERDCSIQRRHQKLVEEAPAPGLAEDERRRLHAMAVAVGEAARLTNAATVEFLRAPDGAYYFLEVNTRLQVEHGVTELVTGVDIVREQLLVAAGQPLSENVVAAAKRAATPVGHAIEVRISAEDPGHDFIPTPGLIRHWLMPSRSGIRVDTAAEAGQRVPPEYDNLLAKVMVHAHDRASAIEGLAAALRETHVAGIQTTLPFHRFVADHPGFRAAELSTGWVGERWDGPATATPAGRLAQIAAALASASPEVASWPKAWGGTRAARLVADGRGGSAWARAALEAAIDRWPPIDGRDVDGRLAAIDGWERQPDGERAMTFDRPSDNHGGFEPAPGGVSDAGAQREPDAVPVPGALRVTISGAAPDDGSAVVGPGPAGGLRSGDRSEPARLVPLDPPRARLETATGPHDILLGELQDPRRAAAGIRRFEVVVDGWRFEVDVEPERRARLRERATAARGDAARGGPVELRAIIPGRVVSVDVAEGDAVDAGGRLLVIEAMKMQNELRSPRAGTVARVAVGPGQTVELGDLLVVVE